MLLGVGVELLLVSYMFLKTVIEFPETYGMNLAKEVKKRARKNLKCKKDNILTVKANKR